LVVEALSHLHGPDVGPLFWLDVGCGKGQTLATVAVAAQWLVPKVTCIGTDIDERYLAECKKVAREHRWDASSFHHVGVEALYRTATPLATSYHLVSVLNVLHELTPSEISRLVVDALRLADGAGQVVLFDMCELPEEEARREFGVVPWSASELGELCDLLTKRVGGGVPNTAFQAFQYELTVPCASVKAHLQWVDRAALQDDTRADRLAGEIREMLCNILDRKAVGLERAIEDGITDLRSRGNPEGEADRINQMIKTLWAVERMIRKERGHDHGPS
jgi:SAM-dependent methyltransferase